MTFTPNRHLNVHFLGHFQGRMPQHFRRLLCAIAALCIFGMAPRAGLAQSGQTTPPPLAMPVSPASPASLPAAAASAPGSHHHGADSATIRMHRLNHLDAQLNADPVELRQSCRYESEIGTAPPQKRIALTFDDGPQAVQTEYILELLRRYNIPATFFLIGSQAHKHPELVQKILADGRHLIGNHSWDHPNFHSIAAVDQAREVQLTDDLLAPAMAQAATPVSPAKYFRYPFGNSSCDTNALLRQSGYRIVGWHIDSCDWAFDKTGAIDAKEAAICGVLPQYRDDYPGHVLAALRAHGGGILLMHEIHPNTLHRLEQIIRSALAEGFTFETLESPAFASALR